VLAKIMAVFADGNQLALDAVGATAPFADQHAGQATGDYRCVVRLHRPCGVHGEGKRALDIIAETVGAMNATADHTAPMTAAAREVARLLRDLETYVSG
jgi:hypothetical protein